MQSQIEREEYDDLPKCDHCRTHLNMNMAIYILDDRTKYLCHLCHKSYPIE
jgi:hypothetical protein